MSRSIARSAESDKQIVLWGMRLCARACSRLCGCARARVREIQPFHSELYANLWDNGAAELTLVLIVISDLEDSLGVASDNPTLFTDASVQDNTCS